MYPDPDDGLDWTFSWNDGNESELHYHGVQPEEAEQVFMNSPTWCPNKKHRSGDFLMMGRTHGGRCLTIVVRIERLQRRIIPITAWDSTTGERTKYF